MKKGFTLLELLIVIGILAILSAVTILVINPAELLRKSRDTQRISDLGSINSALGYFLTSTATISTTGLGDNTKSYAFGYATTCGGPVAHTAVNGTTQVVSGTGWIPVPLNTLTDGSPIASYPIDPNSVTDKRYYVYVTNGQSQWHLAANLESLYYSNGGTDDRETKDGGSMLTVYEVGNNLTLIPAVSTTCFGTGAI